MFISLVDDVNPIVEILSSEERVDMPKEDSKLPKPVSVRDDNSNIVMCAAVIWAILPSGQDGGIFLQDC